jgi:hypothetical protein
MTSLCCCSCGKLIGAREEWTLQCGYSESRQMVPMIVHGTCARAHAAATRHEFQAQAHIRRQRWAEVGRKVD